MNWRKEATTGIKRKWKKQFNTQPYKTKGEFKIRSANMKNNEISTLNAPHFGEELRRLNNNISTYTKNNTKALKASSW